MCAPQGVSEIFSAVRLSSSKLQAAILQLRSATYSNVFDLAIVAQQLCIAVHSVSFITELRIGPVTGCQDGCGLCVRYRFGCLVNGKDTPCRKGRRLYFFVVVYKSYLMVGPSLRR